MKRGFLSNKSLSTKADDEKERQRARQKNPESKLETVSLGKFSHGLVAEAGPPPGYGSHHVPIVDLPASQLDHDPAMILMTSAPQLDDKFCHADYPCGTTQILCNGSTKKFLYSRPGFPQSFSQPKTLAYRIGVTPSSGLGMFAVRTIKQGGLILRERPLVVMPRGGFTTSNKLPDHFTEEQCKQAALYDMEKVLEVLVTRMFEEDKKSLMELYNSHEHDGSGPIYGRVRTNGFGLQVAGMNFRGLKEDESAYVCVCKDLSRINHSCCPNSSRCFDSLTWSWAFYAARDIKEGEEITTHYSTLGDPKADRAKDLLPYGIENCACTACADPESDARRAKILVQGRNVLVQATGEPVQIKVDQVLAVIALYEEEGLESAPGYAEALNSLTPLYAMQNDMAKVEDNIAKAGRVGKGNPS